MDTGRGDLPDSAALLYPFLLLGSIVFVLNVRDTVVMGGYVQYGSIEDSLGLLRMRDAEFK